jgi:hypothetical protein
MLDPSLPLGSTRGLEHLLNAPHAAAELLADGVHTKPYRARLAPLNRGSPSSPHILGTLLPVEEPSTASRPELRRQTALSMKLVEQGLGL